MRLFWDLDTNQLVRGPQSDIPIDGLEIKRRDQFTLELFFLRSTQFGVEVVLPTTTEIRFGVKEDFGGDLLIFSADFTYNSTLKVWVANPNVNTTGINALFEPGEGQPPASVKLLAEFTKRNDAGAGWDSTKTFDVTIFNDLLVGDEGTPVNATEPTDYLTAAQSNARFVRYDAAQSLTTGQQTQTRDNIGAMSLTQGVRVDAAQSLSTGERAQALANLGLTSNGLQAATFFVSRSSNGTSNSSTLFTLAPGTWRILIQGQLQDGQGDVSFNLNTTAASNPFSAGTDIGGVVTRSTNAQAIFTLTNTNSPASASFTGMPGASFRAPINGFGTIVNSANAPMRFSLTVSNYVTSTFVLQGIITAFPIA